MKAQISCNLRDLMVKIHHGCNHSCRWRLEKKFQETSTCHLDCPAKIGIRSTNSDFAKMKSHRHSLRESTNSIYSCPFGCSSRVKCKNKQHTSTRHKLSTPIDGAWETSPEIGSDLGLNSFRVFCVRIYVWCVYVYLRCSSLIMVASVFFWFEISQIGHREDNQMGGEVGCWSKMTERRETPQLGSMS